MADLIRQYGEVKGFLLGIAQILGFMIVLLLSLAQPPGRRATMPANRNRAIRLVQHRLAEGLAHPLRHRPGPLRA